MKKTTLALCAILKNEIKHLKSFVDSVDGAVDAIYFTDTGSTDGSIEFIESLKTSHPHMEIHLSHFDWINDFGAARNFNLEQVDKSKYQYVMWMDLDDRLRNKEAFIKWKESVMTLADYHLSTWHYANDGRGNPVCTFARERVFKPNMGLKWCYPVHEGVPPVPNTVIAYALNWSIWHERTTEDLKNDKGRNLAVIEKIKDPDARMLFYYGKELFENSQNEKSIEKFMLACASPSLEFSDRLLALQYCAYAHMNLKQYEKARDVALMGISLAPNRAEYYVIAGDSYTTQQKFLEAIPLYSAAKNCKDTTTPGMASIIFNQTDCYTAYPRKAIANCLMKLGMIIEAQREIAECCELYPTDLEAKNMKIQVDEAKKNVFGFRFAKDCEDVVITCLGGLYEWDEEVAKKRGVGGSEIAAIEMARHIHKITGRKVIIFNPREKEAVFSGVEYRPTNKLQEYFSAHKPALHIAWRHNVKITDAKTVVWSHDLATQGCQDHKVYDKYLCLSEFQKQYVQYAVGVPEDKATVTRNGIVPERFTEINSCEKNPLKIVFVSSPDRGLDRAIAICDIVRATHPVELHVFYGFQNMRQMGRAEDADRYEKLFAERPWIKVHGNVAQGELPQHYKDAAIWLYPTNFLETFCISALETALCGVFAIVRNYGALPETLKDIPCQIIDEDCVTVDEHMIYAKAVTEAIDQEKWKGVKVDPQKYSWESVAHEWVENYLK